MKKVCCLNNISSKGTSLLGAEYELTTEMTDAEAVLVRSASMHEMELPASLQAIARAGAGVNNIPLEKCADQGIVVFNTPGANANAVKELVLAGMLLSCRDIIGGVEWGRANAENPDVAKAAEKEKKNFAGSEISGKTLGIVGLGAIGYKIAMAAMALGMDVIGYDPFLNLTDVPMTKDLKDIYEKSDFITLHVPLLPDTREMINKESIAMMKDGVVILNYARDLLCNEADLAEALESGKVRKYMCDFANPNTLAMKNTVVTPHLGASTEESEENCAIMAVKQIRNYLENGNIINSVVFPRVDKGEKTKAVRLGVFYKDVDALDEIKTVCGEDVLGGKRGAYGYALVDADAVDAARVAAIPGVYKVREL